MPFLCFRLISWTYVLFSKVSSCHVAGFCDGLKCYCFTGLHRLFLFLSGNSYSSLSTSVMDLARLWDRRPCSSRRGCVTSLSSRITLSQLTVVKHPPNTNCGHPKGIDTRRRARSERRVSSSGPSNFRTLALSMQLYGSLALRSPQTYSSRAKA